ncbi:hypothetical protein FA95DRAFT_1561593 [Auriscalpium vulgare]|uniref:Uncharacterized protein n=1 Tax=Auriscalpium vulgare TaxID=40419 RepID=A0ACB8RLL5_9AGAM|nr:hypothetical protein FA95DRAFT_1561593 [Auriscalpium vulgare]
MLSKASGVIALCFSVVAVRAQTYSATYLPSNAPNHSEQGQAGTNKCGTTASPTSNCQNAYLNAVDDFCVFAPPQPGPGSVIGNTEQIEVSWCMKDGYGTRLIPDGTIQGAHFVQTPDYVQITGIGDLTKINVPKGDAGGELDPHGADGNGNPIGGLVFSSAFTGQIAQVHEWTNFVSDSEFCFRGCKDGPGAPALCQHIYDEMGCEWNMPGNYNGGSFSQCRGDSGPPMGVYGASTFHQGDGATPAPHPAPATSACTPFQTISNGAVSQSSSATPSSASGAVTAPASGASSASRSATLISPTASNTPGAALMGARAPSTGALCSILVASVAGLMGAAALL